MNGLAALLGSRLSAFYEQPLFNGIDVPEPEWFEGAAYLNYPEKGLSLVFDLNWRLAAVQLHAMGHEGFSQWDEPLDDGLTFKSGQSQVRNLLGMPDESGKAQFVPGLGPKPPWDLYRRAYGSVHLEYLVDPEKGLQLISLQTP